MLDFQLFRIKVYPSKQGDLFRRERTRPEMLRETISSLPEAEFRAGQIWHIGNVTTLDDNALYFRLGRISKATIEVFNEAEGAFDDQEFETAPYTHVFVDVELELCAIAKKIPLSPTTAGIARQFGRLLNASPKAVEFQALFEIGDVKDPADFISHLRQAYSISKFWVTFSRPNAFDADADFVKPFQKMVKESRGDNGKAEVKGQSLNSETLEVVARSAAATGDDAGAWIKPSQRARRVRKQLRGSSVNISQEDVSADEEKQNLLNRVRETYRGIRGESGE